MLAFFLYVTFIIFLMLICITSKHDVTCPSLLLIYLSLTFISSLIDEDRCFLSLHLHPASFSSSLQSVLRIMWPVKVHFLLLFICLQPLPLPWFLMLAFYLSMSHSASHLCRQFYAWCDLSKPTSYSSVFNLYHFPDPWCFLPHTGTPSIFLSSSLSSVLRKM